MSYQIRYTVPNTPFEILATCEDTVKVHEQMQQLNALYGNVAKCTKCSGPAKPVCRVTSDGSATYYEWWCENMDCKAKLKLHEFNTKKSGKTGLYRKWQDDFEIWDGEKAATPPI